MSRDELEAWYRATYPDDEDAYNDFWLHTGYREGVDAIGMSHRDVFDAMVYSDVSSHLSNASPDKLRRFARSYQKGVEDKPVIVEGKVREARNRLREGG